jgi:ubiquitin C-terminal hydrolase
VVEHIGKFAHQGHYICYAMDSDDQWKKFDDRKVTEVDIYTVLQKAQAYMLFYELIV